jgi:hypothetical protein
MDRVVPPFERLLHAGESEGKAEVEAQLMAGLEALDAFMNLHGLGPE